jgi:hypothetical protein
MYVDEFQTKPGAVCRNALLRKTCTALVLAALSFLAQCANSGSSDALSPVRITGDEKGGRTEGGVSTSGAMDLVTAHCEKFGRKGFITQMNFESGTMTFECRLQRPKAGAAQ